jgi:serine/threonine-protein kinase RsbW
MASVNQRALPQAVPAIRALVSDFLQGVGVTASQSADIQLAVTEAASNVVRHAYPDCVGPIRCEARARNGTITLTVSDWGCPFSTPAANPGLGMGLPIMEALAVRVARSHVDGMKQVELTFLQSHSVTPMAPTRQAFTRPASAET